MRLRACFCASAPKGALVWAKRKEERKEGGIGQGEGRVVGKKEKPNLRNLSSGGICFGRYVRSVPKAAAESGLYLLGKRTNCR